ncbi:hypothetical protein [Methylotuvimicrobium sp. KM1]|uniref:hypothetical protein n=1 Tax=Methylotuvimicrobium sp. KM1 TaxID=3377707 RepID=UPI00384F1C88
MGLICALTFHNTAEAIVYTASNEASGNQVIAFDVVDSRGRIAELGRFDTEGVGTGALLGNQSAIALDVCN